jgi:hypothetical protein
VHPCKSSRSFSSHPLGARGHWGPQMTAVTSPPQDRPSPWVENPKHLLPLPLWGSSQGPKDISGLGTWPR